MRFRISAILLIALSAAAIAQPVADWTVLVYMSADNDLEKPGMKNLAEMAKVAASGRMNLIVQIDRADREHLLQRAIQAKLLDEGGNQVQEHLRMLLDRLDDRSDGDWTGARRFALGGGRARMLADLGEVDMGDPATLASFLRWGLAEYPARRYFLVLWGHGSGIAPFEKLVDQVMTNFGQYAGILHGTRTVALDNTSDDQLEIDEVAGVLASDEVRGLLRSGRESGRFDVLGFDACLMGQLEVMHALAQVADLFVASESLVPVAGWAYEETFDWLARELDGGRAVAPDQLARRLVDRTIPLPGVFEVVGKAVAGFFIRLFGGQAPERQITLAAVTREREQALEAAVDALAADLERRLEAGRPQAFLRAVTEAKDEAQTFLFEQFVDLFHFTDLLAKKTGEARLALDPAASVVLARHEGKLNENARGVSIFFPVIDYSVLVPDDWYDATAFAKTSRWRGFVRAYLKAYRTYRLGIHVDRMVEKIDGEWEEDRFADARSDGSIRYLAEVIGGDLFVAAVADKPWKASSLLVPLLPYRKRIKESYPAVTRLLEEVKGQLDGMSDSAEVANLRAQAAALAADDALAPAAVLTHPQLDHVLFGTFSQRDVGEFLRRYRAVSQHPWNWDENRYRKAVLKTVGYWDSVLGGLEGRTDAASIRTRAELAAMRAELARLLPRKNDPDEYWHYPAAADHLVKLWTRHRDRNRLEDLIRAREPRPGATAPAPPGTAVRPEGAARDRSRDPADADSELSGR